MDKQGSKILLAEDDPHLGLLLVDYLQAEGFEVQLYKDGELALQGFKRSSFDLCLLDVMMPKMDGFTLAKAIRKENKDIPLIFITARSLKDDKLEGYALGADDYITKPFDEEELLWKVQAMVRRASESNPEALVQTTILGKYAFDYTNQCLSLNGQSRRVTEKEGEILNYMSAHRNQLIKREALLKAVWGENDYFLGRSLDVFISKMRKYLKDDPEINIENVFGVGFIFNVPNQ